MSAYIVMMRPAAAAQSTQQQQQQQQESVQQAPEVLRAKQVLFILQSVQKALTQVGSGPPTFLPPSPSPSP